MISISQMLLSFQLETVSEWVHERQHTLSRTSSRHLSTLFLWTLTPLQL
jgi:hypothetical protein